MVATMTPVAALYEAPEGLKNLLVPALPTLTVIVSAVTALILSDLPDAWSLPARGYAWAVSLPSIVHLNDTAPFSIKTPSPIARLWDPIVSVKSPLAGSYVAPVGVNDWLAPAAPTRTLNVSAVASETVNHWSSAGSPNLGYLCSVALLSIAHVNVRESVASLILSPLVRPWAVFVRTKSPLAGVYAAPVGVKNELPTLVIANAFWYALSFLLRIALVAALTKVCNDTFVEGVIFKVCISNVFVVTLDTGINLPLIGSVLRGYVFWVALLSVAQVNVNELSTTLIKSKFSNPWELRVNVSIPVVGLYTAFVGVCWVVSLLGYTCSVA